MSFSQHKNPFTQSTQKMIEYHNQLCAEMSKKYDIPNLVELKYLAVSSQVELIIYVEPLSLWDELSMRYNGEKTNWQKHYRLTSELIKKYALPKKEQDYDAKIRYFHFFEPCCMDGKVYNASLKIYDKNIFKHFGRVQGEVDDKIVASISKFFREQSIRGPERVIACTLDEHFIAIAIHGITPPFWQRYQRENADAGVMLKSAVKTLVEEAVLHSLNQQSIMQAQILFLDFQQEEDIIFVIVTRNEDEWKAYLQAL